MSNASLKKLASVVNTILLVIIVVLMGYFAYLKATYLLYFSIPTIVVYIINYFLVYTNKLDMFVKFVYVWISIYMSVTTICLGLEPGFHLYSMSLIPIIFCTEYMGYKLQSKNINALKYSIMIAIVYVASGVISVWVGPTYEVSRENKVSLLIINSVSVFCFLIFYTRLLLKMIIQSEEQLKKIAHVDNLTGLYNRHYMIDILTAASEKSKKWIAMADIDNFKKINDTYGHNCGDFVLVKFSEMLNRECTSCTVSRWGGEEFLIMSDAEASGLDVMEQFRAKVAEKPFVFEDKEIVVTVSIGVADFDESYTMDSWIKAADDKLYVAKNSGKNKVVF